MPDAIKKYVQDIDNIFKTGIAREHAYRASLQVFIESINSSVRAINEPARVECGAPDYAVLRNGLSIGYIEAKDIDKSLDDLEKSEQGKRYLKSLQNLVFTNYIEFRWYVHGVKRFECSLGELRANKIVFDPVGEGQTVDLLQDYISQEPDKISSPESLASRLARIADIMHDIIVEAFEKGKTSSGLSGLRDLFSKTLLPGLELKSKTSEFADMYAQTIVYGLFAARCNHDDNNGKFQRIGAASEIPKTNPLLRSLFESVTGTALEDEPFACFVEDCVQLLAHADLDKILSGFGKRVRKEDPVVHFYETFLKEYNPKLKGVRGVFYTPEPVVNFITESVDLLLKGSFSLPGGLADTSKQVQIKNMQGDVMETLPKVLILDPACGTGTFIYSIVDHIRRGLIDRGQNGMWSGYVKDKLLPRVFGFELLMASYAVAHFKIGLQLAGKDLPIGEQNDWRYDFSGKERLNIYLTNTLEQVEKKIANLPGIYHYITAESKASLKIKKDYPIMVIVGNPPYSGASANASWRKVGSKKELTYIGKLIESYKKIDGQTVKEKQMKWIHDDYVKFIRWAQERIDKTGSGIVGYITNNGYLDNPTFRGMRRSLMQSFSDIYILNLHGNVNKKEVAPGGGVDKNVFDIRQGVSIVFLVKKPGHAGDASLHYSDLWGERGEKYKWLDANTIDSVKWTKLSPRAPSYWFIPWDNDLEDEYCESVGINDVFNIFSVGIVSARDKLCIAFTEDEIWNRIERFSSLNVDEARDSFNLGKDARDWKVDTAQNDIKNSGPSRGSISQILYRVFDRRYTYYTGRTKGFLCMPMKRVMQHMIKGNNIAISATRNSEIHGGWSHVFITSNVTQHHTVSLKEVNYIFPLYVFRNLLTREERLNLSWEVDANGRVPNFSNKFIERFSDSLDMTFISDGRGDLGSSYGPEDLLYYMYSVMHSALYRSKYVQFLKSTYPKIPYIEDSELFKKLVVIGEDLALVHLLDPARLTASAYITRFPNAGDDNIAKKFPKYNALGNRVFINEDQYFDGVTPAVWSHEIGGYQVAEKWLKDRIDRTLSYDDVAEYQRIILALSETIRLVKIVDQAITKLPFT